MKLFSNTYTKAPYVVVLTGGVASGKSTFATCFASLGAKVLDTDVFSRQLTAKDGLALPLIREAFGEIYAPIHAEYGLDRIKMRERIFADSLARSTLEGILHPLIREKQWNALMSPPYADINILQIPLFVETGARRSIPSPSTLGEFINVQSVWVVDCDESMQMQRMMNNRHLSREDAQSMIEAQTDRATRRQLADEILQNNHNLAKLELRATWIYQEYCAHAHLQSSDDPR